MGNLSTGGRLGSPKEVPLAEVDVQYPSQSAEQDDPAYWDFQLLFGEADRFFQVV